MQVSERGDLVTRTVLIQVGLCLVGCWVSFRMGQHCKQSNPFLLNQLWSNDYSSFYASVMATMTTTFTTTETEGRCALEPCKSQHTIFHHDSLPGTIIPATVNQLSFPIFGSNVITLNNQLRNVGLKNHDNDTKSSCACTLVTDAYYEEFLYPSLLAHDNPQRVLIFSNNGCVLSHVLKHKPVKHVTIAYGDDVENEGFMDDIHDERVSIVNERTFQQQHIVANDNELYDVVAIDNDTLSIPVNQNDKNLAANIIKSKTDGLLTREGGVLVFPIVNNHFMEGYWSCIEILERENFTSIKSYNLHDPKLQTTIVVASIGDEDFSSSWSARSEAEWNIHLYHRLGEAVKHMLLIDSAQMTMYMYPSKKIERHYCESSMYNDRKRKSNDDGLNNVRSTAYEASCQHGYDPYTTNLPLSNFKIEASKAGTGRGVYTLEDIPPNTYLSLETSIHMVQFSRYGYLIHEYLSENIPEYYDPTNILVTYLDGYGWTTTFWDAVSWGVDSSPMTFVNHGCNSTENVGSIGWEIWDQSPEEAVLDLETNIQGEEVFNPVAERNARIHETIVLSKSFITKGSEVLQNYVTMSVDPEYFDEDMISLLYMCGWKTIDEEIAKNQIYV